MSGDDVWGTMAVSIDSSPVQRERDLLGRTVVVIGGSSDIGLETVRLARARRADVILTARDPDRVHRAHLLLPPQVARYAARFLDHHMVWTSTRTATVLCATGASTNSCASTTLSASGQCKSGSSHLARKHARSDSGKHR